MLSNSRLRLLAAIVVAGAMFLPLATCTQHGRVITHIPIRDNHSPWGLIVTFVLPLLVAAVELFVKARRVRMTALILEPFSALGSAYLVHMATLFMNPTWGYFVAMSGLAVFFISAMAAVIGAWRQRRAARVLAPAT
jgi:hypothetical protein